MKPHVCSRLADSTGDLVGQQLASAVEVVLPGAVPCGVCPDPTPELHRCIAAATGLSPVSQLLDSWAS